MAKLLWEINRPGGYGVQREVVANTRIAAIAEHHTLADCEANQQARAKHNAGYLRASQVLKGEKATDWSAA